MDNQEENSTKPRENEDKETAAAQPGLKHPESEDEQGKTKKAPKVETPKVPDSDTEGIP